MLKVIGTRALTAPPPPEMFLAGLAGLTLAAITLAVEIAARQGGSVTPGLVAVLGFTPLWLGGLGFVMGDRRRAREEALERGRGFAERRAADLAGRQQVVRAVLESAFDPVLVVSADGMVIDGNTKAAKLFGISIDTLPGRALDEFFPDHDDLSTAPPADRRKTPRGVEWRTRAQHEDGSVFPVDLQVSALAAQHIRIYTLREASGQMRKEDTMVRKAMDAHRDRWVIEQRRRGMLLQLLGNGMRTQVDELLQGLAPSGIRGLADQPDKDHRLREAAYGMLDQLDQLWNLAMWERSVAQPTIGPVAMGDVCAQVMADAMPAARRFGKTLECKVHPAVGEVITDANLLTCIVRTLVLSAMRRNEPGVVRLEVLREPGRNTDWITVLVEERGPSFSRVHVEDLKAAFDLSEESSPPVDERAGLALARRLSRALCGHVAVDPLPDGPGLLTHLRIPVDASKLRATGRGDRPAPTYTVGG